VVEEFEGIVLIQERLANYFIQLQLIIGFIVIAIIAVVVAIIVLKLKG
jgi:hypothetical protein